MRILSIETSCDETGIAIVEGARTASGFKFTVIEHALLSQAKLHAEYGGVYPNLAKREHEKNLPILFKKFEHAEVDAVAVTRGPGLEPALWTGIEFAKKLAEKWQKPLLPVNHMEGHIISSLTNHSNFLKKARMSGDLSNIQLPVLALLVSGGHTEFVVSGDWFKYRIIGKTLDDAVGEAFDKVARMLGFSYPGGPEISKYAHLARQKKLISTIKLPRPMLNTDNCDVSFSGLKTAALYALRHRGGIQKLSSDELAAFAAELEDAITDVCIAKTRRALEETGARTFVLGGGVAANAFLRESLAQVIKNEYPEVDFRLPELSITGDNAIMIAEAALARALAGIDDTKIGEVRAVGNLSIAG